MAGICKFVFYYKKQICTIVLVCTYRISFVLEMLQLMRKLFFWGMFQYDDNYRSAF